MRGSGLVALEAQQAEQSFMGVAGDAGAVGRVHAALEQPVGEFLEFRECYGLARRAGKIRPEQLQQGDLVIAVKPAVGGVDNVVDFQHAFGCALLAYLLLNGQQEGLLHDDQSREFPLKAQVMSPHEVITCATATNADLLRMTGKLGVIAPGAYADLLVVNGDPLADLGLLEHQGAHMAAIMKGGEFYKNELDEG